MSDSDGTVKTVELPVANGRAPKRDPSAPDSLFKRVDDRRAERGLSITELGEQARVPFPNLSRFLSGKAWISLENFLDVAAVLDLDPAEVLSDLPDETLRPWGDVGRPRKDRT